VLGRWFCAHFYKKKPYLIKQRVYSLGLEVLDEHSPVFLEFLETDMSENDINVFLENYWWKPEKQDGRRSRAMLELFRDLGRFKKQYPQKVDVYFYNAFAQDYREREMLMAQNISNQIERIQADVNIVLSGRIHTGSKNGLPYDKDAKSMGEHLVAKIPTTKSILLTYSGGKVWSCVKDFCGTNPITKALVFDQRSEGSFGVSKDSNLRHDFYWHIGKVQPSPPANDEVNKH